MSAEPKSRFWLWLFIVLLVVESCGDGAKIRRLQERVQALETSR
jgi:hypothetical protein